jgi:predicted nucleic acid-binding Zn ribbon protein
MKDSIPPHAHCQMCGKSIPVTETLCSEECRQRYQTILRKRKLMVYFMYGMLAALIIVIVLGGQYFN